jgi:hypothetical protein
VGARTEVLRWIGVYVVGVCLWLKKKIVAVATNSATQEIALDSELELNITNVDTDIQKGVDSANNSTVTSASNESLVLAHQLQSMLTIFMTAMQAENAKLASNLEAELNKLADDLDVKLAAVSESLDTKLNAVSDRLDVKINLMNANVTSEMRRENDQIRQEFSLQLQTEVRLITKEVDVVQNSIDTELNNCVKN